MKKLFLIFFALMLFLPAVGASAAVKKEKLLTASQLSGLILIETQSYNRPWYVNPSDGQRYYLKNSGMAYDVLKSLALGISAKDLAKIPTKKGQSADKKLVKRLKGYILLPEAKGDEIWYINPADGLRYSLKDGVTADKLILKFGKKVTDNQLKVVPMNKTQIVFDTTFNDVAYVKYDGTNFSGGYNADKIMPPASMTKLMTALVLLDLNIDFDKKIILTEDQLAYPLTLSGGDKTSEINFKAGDSISIVDLWVAMLVSSSNQAAVALAESTGLSHQEFVSLMNKKAAVLGLKKTLFYDMTGLDPHNVTTSKEMAIIAQTAFSQSKIADTTIINDYKVAAVDIAGNSKFIDVINRNYSLMRYNPQGVKTGFLVEAQRTVSLKKDNSIIVVMHALSMAQRNKIITKLLNDNG